MPDKPFGTISRKPRASRGPQGWTRAAPVARELLAGRHGHGALVPPRPRASSGRRLGPPSPCTRPVRPALTSERLGTPRGSSTGLRASEQRLLAVGLARDRSGVPGPTATSGRDRMGRPPTRAAGDRPTLPLPHRRRRCLRAQSRRRSDPRPARLHHRDAGRRARPRRPRRDPRPRVPRLRVHQPAVCPLSNAAEKLDWVEDNLGPDWRRRMINHQGQDRHSR